MYVEAEEPLALTGEDVSLIQRAVEAALKLAGFARGCEINVTLAGDLSIRALNLEHRDVDAATDVLSFPFYTRDELRYGALSQNMILGDIVISMERAEAQAYEYGHSRERELAFLTVHGALHLMGYDHEAEDGEAEMMAMQEAVLSSMGLNR